MSEREDDRVDEAASRRRLRQQEVLGQILSAAAVMAQPSPHGQPPSPPSSTKASRLERTAKRRQRRKASKRNRR